MTTETMGLRERAAAALAEVVAMEERTAEARVALADSYQALRLRDFATAIGEVLGVVVEPASEVEIEGLLFVPGDFNGIDLRWNCDTCGDRTERYHIKDILDVGRALALMPTVCVDCLDAEAEASAASLKVTVHEPPCPAGWVWLIARVNPPDDPGPICINATDIAYFTRSGDGETFIKGRTGERWWANAEPADVAKLIADAVDNGRAL